MNWEAFHHRGDVLRAVITEVDVRADGILPMNVPGVDETFRDELDLLAALTLRWTTRLSGRIENQLAGQPLDLETAVVDAWRATAEEHPGIRAVIDRHRAEPLDEQMATALARAAAKERSLLALMAGRVSTLGVDDQAVRIGAAIEERARQGLPASRHCAVNEVTAGTVPNFLDRLKAALAA